MKNIFLQVEGVSVIFVALQVLLAADVLCELEDRRELSLSGLVTAFQRECRRYLAAKWLQRRRVLETAIKCIQVRVSQ